MTALLSQSLRGKRDLIRLRQRTRQLTRALGYSARGQALIAAAVFQLGCRALDAGRRGRVAFDLRDGKLRAATSQDAADPERVQLEWPLPPGQSALAPDDLAWAMRELDELTPADLFEEVRQQNLDLLLALQDLQTCRSELGRQRPRRGAA